MGIKTKEQILSEVTGESIYEIRRGHEVQMIRPSECSEAMDEWGKQEAIDFALWLSNKSGCVPRKENNDTVWYFNDGKTVYQTTTEGMYKIYKEQPLDQK